MERPRFSPDQRKPKTIEDARRARELGSKALADIDSVLKEEDEVLANLRAGVKAGVMSGEDLETNLWAYRQTRRIGSLPNPAEHPEMPDPAA